MLEIGGHPGTRAPSRLRSRGRSAIRRSSSPTGCRRGPLRRCRRHAGPAPEDDPRRVATLVQRGDERIAALIHDPALSDDAELIDSVCAAAGLALENERLQADLRSRLAELTASRARARRGERGASDAGSSATSTTARSNGSSRSRWRSASSTRASRPIRTPQRPVLRGPAGADGRARGATPVEPRDPPKHPHRARTRRRARGPREAHRRSPSTLRLELDRRLPDHVESCAYFLISESLANAAKHAHTREATVRVRIEGGCSSSTCTTTGSAARPSTAAPACAA